MMSKEHMNKRQAKGNGERADLFMNTNCTNKPCILYIDGGAGA